MKGNAKASESFDEWMERKHRLLQRSIDAASRGESIYQDLDLSFRFSGAEETIVVGKNFRLPVNLLLLEIES